MTIFNFRTTQNKILGTAIFKTKWHLIYYALASFNLITVLGSFYLNHQLTESYAYSVKINQEWTARLQSYSELGQLAAAVNAPGNDIFESGNPSLELKRLKSASLAFQAKLESIKQELSATRKDNTRFNFLKIAQDLDRVDQSMDSMLVEAEMILGYFQTNQSGIAGQKMAAMDRKFAELNNALVDLRHHVNQIQSGIFEDQKVQVTQLKQYQFWIASSIVILVISLTIYGHQLAQKFALDAQSREKLIEELQTTETELKRLLQELQQTQSQMLQSEKMSALGQMVAGVAHEINNPVNFIHGNLNHIEEYSQSLLNLIQAYQQSYPVPDQKIQQELEAIDLDFLVKDLIKILQSMKVGTERIREIVLSLRNFSRLDEADFKTVDLQEGIESSLLILRHRLKATHQRPEIQIVRDYAQLPPVECYPGQLNQVFMNLLVNAIDALEDVNKSRSPKEIELNPNIIQIKTEVIDQTRIRVSISDNGVGIPEAIRSRLFDPFFTTKPVGKGTGLGLSISYQIVVDKHGGRFYCNSTLGQGTEFVFEIPVYQPRATIQPIQPQAGQTSTLEASFLRSSLS